VLPLLFLDTRPTSRASLKKLRPRQTSREGLYTSYPKVRGRTSRVECNPVKRRPADVLRVPNGIWRPTHPLCRGSPSRTTYPASSAELTASIASPSFAFASVLHCCGDAAGWVPNAVAVLAGR